MMQFEIGGPRMSTLFEGICDALSLTTCDAATVAQTLGGFSAVLATAFGLITVPLAWWQITAQQRLHAQGTLYNS